MTEQGAPPKVSETRTIRCVDERAVQLRGHRRLRATRRSLEKPLTQGKGETGRPKG